MIKSKFGFLKFPAASPVLTRKPPPQVYADKRTTVNLCCEADGSLVWTRAQRALTLVPSSQQNGCLTLSNVNKQSSGKYTCRASNEFGFAEATTEVIYTGCVTFLTFPFQKHFFVKIILVSNSSFKFANDNLPRDLPIN